MGSQNVPQNSDMTHAANCKVDEIRYFISGVYFKYQHSMCRPT